MLTREQEATIAANEDLQNELDMYKSVVYPGDQKPRTNMTRVGRPPLVNLARTLNVVNGVGGPAVPLRQSSQGGTALETIPGDMTFEEIS
jgi:hypothetical protein